MFSSTKKELSQEELNNSNNIIGKGTSLKGDLSTPGSLRIEGKVSGSIRTSAKVVLGDTSVIEGDITAQTAEIGGSVQGTIKVSGLLILKSTAVVNGDIITNKLVFEAGARFNGKCNMDKSLKETESTPSTSTSKSTPLIESHTQPVKLAKKER